HQWSSDAHHKPRSGQSEWSVDGSAQLTHELAIGNRIRRGCDVNTLHLLVRNGALKQTIHVLFMYPTDPLPTMPDGTAQSPACQVAEPPQRAAVAAKHKAGAQ